ALYCGEDADRAAFYADGTSYTTCDDLDAHGLADLHRPIGLEEQRLHAQLADADGRRRFTLGRHRPSIHAWRHDVRSVLSLFRMLEDIVGEVAALRGRLVALGHELERDAAYVAQQIAQLHHADDIRHHVDRARAIGARDVEPLDGSDLADVGVGLE